MYMFADGSNHRVRKITPNGIVSTIAGSTLGYTDGQGAAAKFYNPSRVAIDQFDNLYVSDQYNGKN